MKKYRRFYRNYKRFVNAGAFLAVMLAIAVFAVVPGVQTVQRIVSETGQLKSEVDSMKKKIATLESMDETQLSDVAQALRLAVPTEKDVAGAMTGMEQLMSQYGISIDTITLTGGSVSTGSAAKSGIDRKLGIGMMPVGLSLKGQVSAIRDMLDTSVKVRRLMNITDFDLSIGSLAASATGEVRSNITAQMFFLPSPTNIGKITDPIATLTAAEQQLITDISSLPVVSDVAQETSVPVDMPAGAGRENPFIP